MSALRPNYRYIFDAALQVFLQRLVTLYWVAASRCFVDALLVKFAVERRDSIGDIMLHEKRTNGFANGLNLCVMLIDESRFKIYSRPLNLNRALQLALGVLMARVASIYALNFSWTLKIRLHRESEGVLSYVLRERLVFSRLAR